MEYLELHLVEDDSEVQVPNQADRFLAHPAGLAGVADWWGDTSLHALEIARKQWDTYARNQMAYAVLSQVFTFEECLRLWMGSCVQTDLGDVLQKEHPLLERLDTCLWQYGFTRSWNTFVQSLAGLSRLQINLPDFETKLTWAPPLRGDGPARHLTTLWLDGAFGLLLYYKGEHVLTVGFGLASEGALIAQVQLRRKQGNRFCYRLPQHYLDMVLDLFQEAFGAVWLITGTSAVDSIRKAFGRHVPDDYTPEVQARITSFYERPLDGFDRQVKTLQREGRTFRALTKIAAQDRAA